MSVMETSNDRRAIYYWKCDRPAAFHGTHGHRDDSSIAGLLQVELERVFAGQHVSIQPAGGQGNHRTYLAGVGGDEWFVRVEDGPEGDEYLEVESAVIEAVSGAGVPVPKVRAVDATRERVPFAWQVLEKIPQPDLNQHHKAGRLDLGAAAEAIGAAVARWQWIEPAGFGPFDVRAWREGRTLSGFHARYADYFFLNFERHLEFLVEREFFPSTEATEIRREIERHRELLEIEQGCLVHKDLALWNVLGPADGIAAFIDWDDAIAGDPLDDLSLLGCFYDGAIVGRALEGYRAVRPLPEDYRRRFWLHLLRNMIVKAVIRVGAGYFDRADGFFLIPKGDAGADFKTFTQARLTAALHGLKTSSDPLTL